MPGIKRDTEWLTKTCEELLERVEVLEQEKRERNCKRHEYDMTIRGHFNLYVIRCKHCSHEKHVTYEEWKVIELAQAKAKVFKPMG